MKDDLALVAAALQSGYGDATQTHLDRQVARNILDALLAAEAEIDRWLQPCGACDGGLPMDCTHPDTDPRPVIYDLKAGRDAARGIATELEQRLAAVVALCEQPAIYIHDVLRAAAGGGLGA